MPDDTKSFLGRLLADIEQKVPNKSIVIDEGMYTYELVKEQPKEWRVHKYFFSDLVGDYAVRRIGEKWLCDCPAGRYGRGCKHATWVAAIVMFDKGR